MKFIFFLFFVPSLGAETLKVVSYNIRHGNGLVVMINLYRVAKLIA